MKTVAPPQSRVFDFMQFEITTWRMMEIVATYFRALKQCMAIGIDKTCNFGKITFMCNVKYQRDNRASDLFNFRFNGDDE